MSKPRLTEKRLRGLGAMAGLIEAGPSLEETFYDSAAEVAAALEWIRDMQEWKSHPDPIDYPDPERR